MKLHARFIEYIVFDTNIFFKEEYIMQQIYRRLTAAVILGMLILVMFVQSVGAVTITPTSGYGINHIASVSPSGGSSGAMGLLEYNPITDTWLGIDTAGFDYINEARRNGTGGVIASTFGLGGTGGDMLGVTSNSNIAYTVEPHARSIYRLSPGSSGATKTLIANAPRDPNGSGTPEEAVIETDGNGNVWVSFPGTGDWFRYNSNGTLLNDVDASSHSLNYLERNASTGAYYGVDSNSTSSQLFNVDPTTGQVSAISLISSYIADIECDWTQDIISQNVLWAIRWSATDGYSVVGIDPITGNLGSTLATVSGGSFSGLALAPSSADMNVYSLYVSTFTSGTGEDDVYEIFLNDVQTVPEPTTIILLGFGLSLIGLAGYRKKFKKR